MDKVLVRIVDSNPIHIEDLFNHKLISDKDKQESFRYLRSENKKEKATAFILRNKYIGKVYVSARGKPLSKTKFFNISHSKGIVAIAIADRDVGIDLEVVRPVDKSLKEYVSSKDEKKVIHDDASFFEVWTNKESLLKCTGSGIKGNMDKVPSLPFNNVKFYDGAYFFSSTVTYKKSVITVTRRSTEPFEIEIIEEKI